MLKRKIMSAFLKAYGDVPCINSKIYERTEKKGKEMLT